MRVERLTMLMFAVGSASLCVALRASAVSGAAAATARELSSLEAAGRAVYVRERCASCHSQPELGAPLQAPEAERGPSLEGVGGKYPNHWHYKHLQQPSSTSPGSTMPAYPQLFIDRVSGVDAAAKAQGQLIARRLGELSYDASWDHEVVALIAFLQALKPEAGAQAPRPPMSLVVDPKDPATLAAGEKIYLSTCSPCHGDDLSGGIGPSLVDQEWSGGGELEQILQSVAEGVPDKGMPRWGPILGEENVGRVSAYVYFVGQERGVVGD